MAPALPSAGSRRGRQRTRQRMGRAAPVEHPASSSWIGASSPERRLPAQASELLERHPGVQGEEVLAQDLLLAQRPTGLLARAIPARDSQLLQATIRPIRRLERTMAWKRSGGVQLSWRRAAPRWWSPAPRWWTGAPRWSSPAPRWWTGAPRSSSPAPRWWTAAPRWSSPAPRWWTAAPRWSSPAPGGRGPAPPGAPSSRVISRPQAHDVGEAPAGIHIRLHLDTQDHAAVPSGRTIETCSTRRVARGHPGILDGHAEGSGAGALFELRQAASEHPVRDAEALPRCRAGGDGIPVPIHKDEGNGHLGYLYGGVAHQIAVLPAALERGRLHGRNGTEQQVSLPRSLEDAVPRLHGPEDRRPAHQRLRFSQEEIAVVTEGVVEPLQERLLRLAVEVDQQVPAHQDVQARDRRVLQHVVVTEDHHRADLPPGPVAAAGQLFEVAFPPLRRDVGEAVRIVDSRARPRRLFTIRTASPTSRRSGGNATSKSCPTAYRAPREIRSMVIFGPPATCWSTRPISRLDVLGVPEPVDLLRQRDAGAASGSITPWFTMAISSWEKRRR